MDYLFELLPQGNRVDFETLGFWLIMPKSLPILVKTWPLEDCDIYIYIASGFL